MTEKDKLIPNEKYWSIQPSVESDEYDDKRPRYPWEGKLSLIPGGTLRLCRFDDKGVRSDDPNSYAVVKPEQLFATEAEAMEVYKQKCTSHAECLIEEGMSWFKQAISPERIRFV